MSSPDPFKRINRFYSTFLYQIKAINRFRNLFRAPLLATIFFANSISPIPSFSQDEYDLQEEPEQKIILKSPSDSEGEGSDPKKYKKRSRSGINDFEVEGEGSVWKLIEKHRAERYYSKMQRWSRMLRAPDVQKIIGRILSDFQATALVGTNRLFLSYIWRDRNFNASVSKVNIEGVSVYDITIHSELIETLMGRGLIVDIFDVKRRLKLEELLKPYRGQESALLAAVLAHEVGHIVLEHGGSTPIKELEADRFAARLLKHSGYPSKGIVTVLKIIDLLSQEGRPLGKLSRYLSEHPSPRIRIGELQDLIDRLSAIALKKPSAKSAREPLLVPIPALDYSPPKKSYDLPLQLASDQFKLMDWRHQLHYLERVLQVHRISSHSNRSEIMQVIDVYKELLEKCDSLDSLSQWIVSLNFFISNNKVVSDPHPGHNTVRAHRELVTTANKKALGFLGIPKKGEPDLQKIKENVQYLDKGYVFGSLRRLIISASSYDEVVEYLLEEKDIHHLLRDPFNRRKKSSEYLDELLLAAMRRVLIITQDFRKALQVYFEFTDPTQFEEKIPQAIGELITYSLKMNKPVRVSTMLSAFKKREEGYDAVLYDLFNSSYESLVAAISGVVKIWIRAKKNGTLPKNEFQLETVSSMKYGKAVRVLPVTAYSSKQVEMLSLLLERDVLSQLAFVFQRDRWTISETLELLARRNPSQSEVFERFNSYILNFLPHSSTATLIENIRKIARFIQNHSNLQGNFSEDEIERISISIEELSLNASEILQKRTLQTIDRLSVLRRARVSDSMNSKRIIPSFDARHLTTLSLDRRLEYLKKSFDQFFMQIIVWSRKVHHDDNLKKYLDSIQVSLEERISFLKKSKRYAYKKYIPRYESLLERFESIRTEIDTYLSDSRTHGISSVDPSFYRNLMEAVKISFYANTENSIFDIKEGRSQLSFSEYEYPKEIRERWSVLFSEQMMALFLENFQFFETLLTGKYEESGLSLFRENLKKITSFMSQYLGVNKERASELSLKSFLEVIGFHDDPKESAKLRSNESSSFEIQSEHFPWAGRYFSGFGYDKKIVYQEKNPWFEWNLIPFVLMEATNQEDPIKGLIFSLAFLRSVKYFSYGKESKPPEYLYQIAYSLLGRALGKVETKSQMHAFLFVLDQFIFVSPHSKDRQYKRHALGELFKNLDKIEFENSEIETINSTRYRGVFFGALFEKIEKFNADQNLTKKEIKSVKDKIRSLTDTSVLIQKILYGRIGINFKSGAPFRRFANRWGKYFRDQWIETVALLAPWSPGADEFTVNYIKRHYSVAEDETDAKKRSNAVRLAQFIRRPQKKAEIYEWILEVHGEGKLKLKEKIEKLLTLRKLYRKALAKWGKETLDKLRSAKSDAERLEILRQRVFERRRFSEKKSSGLLGISEEDIKTLLEMRRIQNELNQDLTEEIHQLFFEGSRYRDDFIERISKTSEDDFMTLISREEKKTRGTRDSPISKIGKLVIDFISDYNQRLNADGQLNLVFFLGGIEKELATETKLQVRNHFYGQRNREQFLKRHGLYVHPKEIRHYFQELHVDEKTAVYRSFFVGSNTILGNPKAKKQLIDRIIGLDSNIPEFLRKTLRLVFKHMTDTELGNFSARLFAEGKETSSFTGPMIVRLATHQGGPLSKKLMQLVASYGFNLPEEYRLVGEEFKGSANEINKIDVFRLIADQIPEAQFSDILSLNHEVGSGGLKVTYTATIIDRSQTYSKFSRFLHKIARLITFGSYGLEFRGSYPIRKIALKQTVEFARERINREQKLGEDVIRDLQADPKTRVEGLEALFRQAVWTTVRELDRQVERENMQSHKESAEHRPFFLKRWFSRAKVIFPQGNPKWQFENLSGEDFVDAKSFESLPEKSKNRWSKERLAYESIREIFVQILAFSNPKEHLVSADGTRELIVDLDPHEENQLAMSRRTLFGRLRLGNIDLGQSRRFKVDEIKRLAQVVVALFQNRSKDAAHLFRDFLSNHTEAQFQKFEERLESVLINSISRNSDTKTVIGLGKVFSIDPFSVLVEVLEKGRVDGIQLKEEYFVFQKLFGTITGLKRRLFPNLSGTSKEKESANALLSIIKGIVTQKAITQPKSLKRLLTDLTESPTSASSCENTHRLDDVSGL